MMSVLKRIGQALITLWGVSLIVFLLVYVAPGLGQTDPTDAMANAVAGAHATPDTIKNIKRDLGLDKPYFFNWSNLGHPESGGVFDSQYFLFIGDSLTNKLHSFRNHDLIYSAIGRRFFNTLLLAVTALAIYLLVAVPTSLLTARAEGKFVDRFALVICVVAVSVPTFWLGRLLQQYPGYQWGWFSVGGNANLWNLPLPALTLGIGGAAYYSRLLHTNLRGVVRQDYVRAARARGLSESRIMIKHALRNALMPALAVLGLEFASLLSGLIFTEKIFGWPGIGSLAVDSVMNQDAPMIMGTVMFAATMVVLANMVVDFLYMVVDPRVRGN